MEATSAYIQGKYGDSPISFRPKEGCGAQKTKASRGVIFFVACFALFEYMPRAWHSEASNLANLDHIPWLWNTGLRWKEMRTENRTTERETFEA
jgi:hypothetical protein